MKVRARLGEGYPPGPKAGTFSRRLVALTRSRDFLEWEKPWRIFVPDQNDEGLLEFYGRGGTHARGRLLVGSVRVLRDDLPHEPGGAVEGIGYTVLATAAGRPVRLAFGLRDDLNASPGRNAAEMGDKDRKAAGIGYTVLAWSRDGRRWQRDDQPFILNDPNPARWDHAMAWGDEQIIVGDETHLYYGGYQRGHKVARYEERQIGLVRMPRDRYVAREADLNPRRLLTRALVLQGRALKANARIVGAMRVRLEFELTEAQLFGFEIE